MERELFLSCMIKKKNPHRSFAHRMGNKTDRKTKSRAQNSKPKNLKRKNAFLHFFTLRFAFSQLSKSLVPLLFPTHSNPLRLTTFKVQNTQAWKHSMHRVICSEISLWVCDLLVCLRCKYCSIRKQQVSARTWNSNAWDSYTKSCDYALVLADCSVIILAPGEDTIPHSNTASRSEKRKLKTPQWMSRFFRHQVSLYPLTLLTSTPTSGALFHISSSTVSAAARQTHLPH